MTSMPLSKEQALDESTHRKVEGAFDELQRAARNIERAARQIEAEGGEQRLVDLLDATSEDLREQLKRTMSKAYFRPPTDEESASLGQWKQSLPPEPEVEEKDEQASLFGGNGDDALAA
jgi:hypothetical protein